MPSGSTPDDARPAELVMIGASVTNGRGYGREATQQSSDPEALACAKARTRKALRAFLEWTRTETPLCEAFVWNTCQRIELYGWLPASEDAAARAHLLDRIQGALFGVEPPSGLRVNMLANRGARHHLLRTACGLNSALPGDRDVVAQLQTACRIAQCAHTAGPRAAALVDEATALAREVNTMTAWGRFSAGYCAAALARICEVDGVRPDRFRHLVIGGSTTSRAILSTLVEEHAVPHRQLTLVYRDHHGQMRQLRAALGSGRRIRVHAYGEESVLRAIADADFVYFGIDQAEPVLDAIALVGLRDHAVRPLTLVDFNTSGSVSGTECLGPISLWRAKELDQAVAAQAAVTSSRSGFAGAVAEAEAWILRSLGPEPESRDTVPVSDAGPWSVRP
jgi:glutamyl-tRNA reductase